jgi:ribokinase
MKVAVVGHVEWVQFARVPKLPAEGEIVHATETWEMAGGGGAVAARVLARLNGSCSFFTALGEDEAGRRALQELTAAGVHMHAAFRPTPTRRAFTHIDATGERTITVMGERMGPRAADPLPWEALASTNGVYVTSGDAAAMLRAREAAVVVATSRDLPPLRESRIQIDALVGSAFDPGEVYRDGDLDPAPRHVIRTEGARGGTRQQSGQSQIRYDAIPVSGAADNTYGAGDSFAAGLTFALAQGQQIEHAVAFAARCGADAIART